MSTRRKVASAAAIALALAGALAGARALRLTDPPAAVSIARLSSAFGEVSIRRAGSFTFRRASVGAQLGAGDSVKTGSASRAVILYAAGASVHVDPASLLVVVAQEDAALRSLVLAEGAVSGALATGIPSRVAVRRPDDEEPVARIERAGSEQTSFRVRLLEKDQAEVAILHGEADVSRAGKPVRVRGGQSLELPPAGDPGQPVDLPHFPSLREPEVEAQLDLSASGMVMLGWDPVPGATLYQVQVAHAEGAGVDFDALAVDTAVAPPALRFVPPSTGAYVWRVASLDGSGRQGEYGFARRFVVHSLNPEALPADEPAGALEAQATGDLLLAGDRISGGVHLPAGSRLQARGASSLGLGPSSLSLGAGTDLEIGELERAGSALKLAGTLRAGAVTADLADAPLASLALRSEGAQVFIAAGSRVAVELRGGILRAVCERGDAEVAGAGRTVRLVSGEAVDVGPAGPGERMRLPDAPELVQPGPSTTLPPGPVRFAWKPERHALRYRLLVSRSHSVEAPLEDRVVQGTSASVHLGPGSFAWSVTALDGAGLASARNEVRSLSLAAEPASREEAPGIAIVRPASGATVRTDTVELVGRAAPGSHVSVNTSEVAVQPGGDFRTRVPLQPGTNSIDVEAVDDTGHSTSASLRVERAEAR